jgi:hypothetical protein
MKCSHPFPTSFSRGGFHIEWCPDCGAIRPEEYVNWELPKQAINVKKKLVSYCICHIDDYGIEINPECSHHGTQ